MDIAVPQSGHRDAEGGDTMSVETIAEVESDPVKK
ncbi:MAG: hypothetical protein QOJ74_1200, partial [Ilumatobacteraceae bacterium]|nr:hypothetical protein [Ilumatobacteraceae bacterium]